MTTLRDGRYVLTRPLGEGAQGTTWDAVDKREGRPVAVKRFDVRGAKQWKDIELAEREARVLASLSHPKLPKYIDHFEEDGVLYLVMEKIEGTPASSAPKALGEDDVFRLLRDAADVLHYLHTRAPPVIHRDIKPSNVIRRPDGSFVLVDFGAVRERLRADGGSSVVGTFGYMAPEQFQGRATPATDVYALGATALTLLTGLRPEEWPHRGLEVDVNELLGNRTSPRLRHALTRMLEPNPDARPSDVAALLRENVRNESETRSNGERASGGYRAVFKETIGDEVRNRVERELQKKMARVRAKLERQADKRRRREEARAKRHGNPHRWEDFRVNPNWPNHSAPFALPWIAIMLVGIGLFVARTMVVLSLRIVAPVALVLLAIVFGRGLRNAARSVSDAGGRANDALGRAQARIRVNREQQGANEASAPSGKRVSDPGAARSRIVDAELVDEGIDSAEPDEPGAERRPPSDKSRRA